MVENAQRKADADGRRHREDALRKVPAGEQVSEEEEAGTREAARRARGDPVLMDESRVIVFTVPGAPRQKKNSGRIVFLGKRCHGCRRGVSPRILPSKPWEAWSRLAIPLVRELKIPTIMEPVNCAALFFCDTKRTVDPCNLYEGLADILEAAKIVENDSLLATWDGSRLHLDRENPRVDVTLTLHSEPERRT